MTRTTEAEQMEASDFSHAGIERRATHGLALAHKALEAEGFI